MSEVELYLIQDGENCTIYTLQFLRMSNLNLKNLLPSSEKMPNTARISRVSPHLSSVLPRREHWNDTSVRRAE